MSSVASALRLATPAVTLVTGVLEWRAGQEVGLGLPERTATEGREANEGRTVHERAHEKGAMNVNALTMSWPAVL